MSILAPLVLFAPAILFALIARWLRYIGRTVSGSTDDLDWPEAVAFGRVMAWALSGIGTALAVVAWIGGVVTGAINAWSLVLLVGIPAYAAFKVTEWAQAKSARREGTL